MTADEIVVGLIESLEKAANADPRLQPAFDREQATEALLQGMVIEGHIDLSALRSLLTSRGAPEEVLRSIMLQLDALATNKGLVVVEGLFSDPGAETVIAADGFLPAAEIQKEKENVDRALVAVVVRNTELHVDMDEFRAKMLTALDAALQTGDVDLEPLDQFLAATDTEETARQETLLTLVQLSKSGRTRYKLLLPPSVGALTEAEQNEILEAFNKRSPSKDITPAPPTRPKRDEKDKEKKAQQPAYVPPSKEKSKKKKKSKVLRWMIVLGTLLAGGAGVAAWQVAPKATFVPAQIVLPPDAMPCSQLLVRGNEVFCGMKVKGWTSIGDFPLEKRNAMKLKTKEAVMAAGFKKVTFGLDTSK